MRKAVRLLPLLAACLTTAACATAPVSAPLHTGSKLTPTEQFGIQVSQTPDRIQLAPRPGALSTAQVEAVSALAQRWRETGQGLIRVEAPSNGPNQGIGGQAAQAVARVLQDNGVPAELVALASYDPAGKPEATVAVSYVKYATVVPNCPAFVGDVTLTFQNEPSPEFGCSVTANLAAQIANPSDLLAVRPEGPSDGARRAVVLGKYREGTSTASSRGADERGVVSNAVQ